MQLTERQAAAPPSWGWYVVGGCFCIAVFGWGLGLSRTAAVLGHRGPVRAGADRAGRIPEPAVVDTRALARGGPGRGGGLGDRDCSRSRPGRPGLGPRLPQPALGGRCRVRHPGRRLLGLVLWRTASVPAAYLACAVFGLSVGNVTTLPALLVHREFPPAAFTQVVSLSTAIGQATYAFGPALLAVIHDSTGSYRPELAACIALEFAAAAMVRAWPSTPRWLRREQFSVMCEQPG
jgi:hypothetical protein